MAKASTSSSKRAKAAALSAQTITAKIGRTQVPIRLCSYELRRLLRAAAQRCSLDSESLSGMTQHKLRILATNYRHGLFMLIAAKALSAARPELTEFEEGDLVIDDGHVLEFLKEKIQDASLPERRRDALLARLQWVSLHCRLNSLQRSYSDLDVILLFQRRLGAVQHSPLVSTMGGTHRSLMIRESIPWEPSDPPLQVGVNGSFFGYSQLHPSELVNMLAIGGTGSGKTRSVVLPVLEALLRYRLHCGTTSSILIVDPKKELGSHTRRILGQLGELDRLVVIGEGKRLCAFPPGDTSSISDRLERLQSYCPAQGDQGDHTYWTNLAKSMLLDFMQLEDEFFRNTGGRRLTSVICQELGLQDAGSGFWQQLRTLLNYSCSRSQKLVETDTMLRFVCQQGLVRSRAVRVLEMYNGDHELLRQWTYVVQSALPMLVSLANPDHAHAIDLDPVAPPHGEFLNVAELVESGSVILYCPQPSESDRLTTMLLKSAFYRSVFARKDMRRPIGVVVDEFQRFVSADKYSGEASFLDTVRSARGISVYATQSLASLSNALGKGQSDTISVVTANTPSRVVLRTTDPETLAWLKTQIPGIVDGPHILDIRRPATMRPGEGYLMLADGTWDRRRATLPKLGIIQSTTGSLEVSP